MKPGDRNADGLDQDGDREWQSGDNRDVCGEDALEQKEHEHPLKDRRCCNRAADTGCEKNSYSQNKQDSWKLKS